MKKRSLIDGEKKILEFGKEILTSYFEHDCSDIDGGDVDTMLHRTGCYEDFKMDAPCVPDDQVCWCRDEYGLDFPLTCSRLTQKVQAARKQNDKRGTA